MHADRGRTPRQPLLSERAVLLYARCIVYLIVWLGLGALGAAGAAAGESGAAAVPPGAPRTYPAGLTVTFAAIDYTLSLEPHFKSSIYGMLVGDRSGACSLSRSRVMGMTLAAPARPPDGDARSWAGCCSRLLVLWAYLDFMQLLIVWNSDLPHEADWYLLAPRGGWAIVAAADRGAAFRAAVLRAALAAGAALARGAGMCRNVTGAHRGAARLVDRDPCRRAAVSLLDGVAMIAVLGLAAGIALRAFRRHGSSDAVASHG